MALQGIDGVLPVPHWFDGISTNGLGFGSNVIDAAGEKVALIIRAPKTGTLERVGIRFGTVTTAADIKVSFQNVSSLDADGTADQYRVISSASVVSNTFVESGIMSSDGTDTGTKRSVTKGELFAVVVEFDSSAGNLQVSSTTAPSFLLAPYCRHFTTAWATTNSLMLVGLKYTDNYELIGAGWPFSALTLLSNGNGGNPDEYGNVFTLPFKARVTGWWGVMLFTSGRNFDIVIYDNSNNVLLSSSYLGENMRPSNAGLAQLYFDSTVELAANTTYRIVLKPTTISGNSLQFGTVASAAILNSLPMGDAFKRTHRTDAGAWTDTNTERFFLGLLVDQLDDGVSSGGLLTHPSMAGGMRG